MPNFFHNIRKRLLKEKRFLKYLQYALGEIVLVVIGILIALYINNRNQQKKTENRIITVLEEVQNDLGKNISEAEKLKEFYAHRDSIIEVVVNDQLDRQDYIDHVNLRFLATGVDHIKIYTNGYNNLIRNTDQLPHNYRSLLQPLNELYVYNKYEVDKFDERMHILTDRFHDYLSTEKIWFEQWYYSDTLPGVAMDYFLNDPYYKNALLTYASYGNLLATEAGNFQLNAVRIYRQIHELLGQNEKLPDFIPQNQVKIPKKELREFTGLYRDEEGYEIHLVQKEDHLQWIFDDDNIKPLNYYFKSRNTIYNIVEQLHFKRESGNIIGVWGEWGNTHYYYEKLNPNQIN